MWTSQTFYGNPSVTDVPSPSNVDNIRRNHNQLLMRDSVYSPSYGANSMAQFQMGPSLNHQPSQILPSSPDQQHNGVHPPHYSQGLGVTSYFYNRVGNVLKTPRQIFLRYSMYTGVPPHIAYTDRNTSTETFFTGDEIKQDLLRRQAALLSEVEGVSDEPAEVDNYCNIVPLEINGRDQLSRKIGRPCTVYKAINKRDGVTYCLHRIHEFKFKNPKVMQIINKWKEISSPHIVTLREVFTTKSFNDSSIVFVYDYHPTADTLEMKFFSSPPSANGYPNPLSPDGSATPDITGTGAAKPYEACSEASIWSYIIQLSGALRVIHAANLSARNILPSKVIVMDKNRLKINCVCISDILTFESAETTRYSVTHHQQEDLHSLGRLVLALACNSQLALLTENVHSALAFIHTYYSADLNYVIRTLLLFTHNPQGPLNIRDIMHLIGSRFYTEVESRHNKIESLEHGLTKECENGRLFRILAKLNTIHDRPEFIGDASWSETGDRYLLKLFRNYVYHQTTETGERLINMTHIISCLNKLDAGVPETVPLSRGDPTNVSNVSYHELRRQFEGLFGSLTRANR